MYTPPIWGHKGQNVRAVGPYRKFVIRRSEIHRTHYFYSISSQDIHNGMGGQCCPVVRSYPNLMIRQPKIHRNYYFHSISSHDVYDVNKGSA